MKLVLGFSIVWNSKCLISKRITKFQILTFENWTMFFGQNHSHWQFTKTHSLNLKVQYTRQNRVLFQNLPSFSLFHSIKIIPQVWLLNNTAAITFLRRSLHASFQQTNPISNMWFSFSRSVWWTVAPLPGSRWISDDYNGTRYSRLVTGTTYAKHAHFVDSD